MRPPAQFPQEIATEADDQPDPRMVGMMICTRLAGRAVIRVVGRCNEAKENEQLGEWYLSEKCFREGPNKGISNTIECVKRDIS